MQKDDIDNPWWFVNSLEDNIFHDVLLDANNETYVDIILNKMEEQRYRES